MAGAAVLTIINAAIAAGVRPPPSFHHHHHHQHRLTRAIAATVAITVTVAHTIDTASAEEWRTWGLTSMLLEDEA